MGEFPLRATMKFSSAISTIVLLFPTIALGGWPTVKTTNGPIIGHLAPEPPEVAEFLGIPYASPRLASCASSLRSDTPDGRSSSPQTLKVNPIQLLLLDTRD